MSSAGAAPRAAVQISSARADASRRNGAKSRGPKTADGKGRSAQNALKHGMRAQKYLVLPDEDAAEFADLQAAIVEELAPVGALQAVLARRVAIAAWRLARADRIESDLFAERSWGSDATPGLALIRDGNGTRSFETLLRYRGAAMAEFSRALRTLKALQAEARAHATAEVETPVRPRTVAPTSAAATLDRSVAAEQKPNEPERRRNSGLAGVSWGGVPSPRDPGPISLPPLPLAMPGTAALARTIEPEIRHPGGGAPAMPTHPARSR